NHHDVYKFMPSAGEPFYYNFNRTMNGTVPAAGAGQSWGWMYQLMPFIEQDNLWKYYEPDTNWMDLQFQGDYFILAQMPKTYSCPSRREGGILNTDPYPWNGVPVQVISTDYAGNGGTYSLGWDNQTDGTNNTGVFQGVMHALDPTGNFLIPTVIKGKPL